MPLRCRPPAAVPTLAALVFMTACAGGAGPASPSARVPEGATPGLQVQLQERFYPVAGTSARTLNRALATEGPRKAGRRAHALTEWRVAWSYVPVSGRAVCASVRPTVSVEIVTTLPRWVDLDSASDRLVSDWALFLARLRDHESRHQYLALQGSRELLRTLAALEAPSCDLLQTKAELAVSALTESYEAQHQLVDERAQDPQLP
jgi:predicted secreted Zn-dependent protease